MAEPDRSGLPPIPYSVFIPGVQKAATSTLYGLLVRHRNVATSGRKERHFFDDESQDWAAPDYTSYVAKPSGPKARIAIDATPSYLFWPQALERIQRYQPQARLILSFRDPVERAFSQWLMNAGRAAAAGKGAPTFAQALRRAAVWDARLTSGEPLASTRGLRDDSLVSRGRYGEQLRRARDLFSAEQVMEVDFAVLVRHQVESARAAFAFLGLPPMRREIEPLTANPSTQGLAAPPPSPADVDTLVGLLAEDFGDFQAATSLDVRGWTTARLLRGDLAPSEVATRLANKAGLR